MDKVIGIGGIGGSGTRVVADILVRLDIYIGDWLKHTKDNLAFTALLRDSSLMARDQNIEVSRRIELFVKYMKSNKLSLKEAIDFHKTAKRNSFYSTKKRDIFYPLSKVISTKTNREVWGWKEPNTYFFIKELFSAIPNLKYIHVLRHGLDMAFSNNSRQLKNWAHHLGMSYSGEEDPDELAYKKLEFWVRSTELYLQLSDQVDRNTLIFNHNHFCDDPKKTIQLVCDFLDLNTTSNNRQNLSKLVSRTDSNGRYKKYDLGIFDNRQIEFVKEMGFEV